MTTMNMQDLLDKYASACYWKHLAELNESEPQLKYFSGLAYGLMMGIEVTYGCLPKVEMLPVGKSYVDKVKVSFEYGSITYSIDEL